MIGNQTGPRQLELPPKAPVRDSAGLVVDAVPLAAQVQHERLLPVDRAEGADAVVGQELVRVEHPRQQRLHAVAADERQQPPLADARLLPRRDERGEVRAVVQEPVHAALKPGSGSSSSGSIVSTARSGISPTSERTLSGMNSPVSRWSTS